MMSHSKELDSVVRTFAAFLSVSWPCIKKIGQNSTTGSYIDDWMQASWECLVEGAIEPPGKVFLEVYGSGADCNNNSSRVYRPDMLPSHMIVCTSTDGLAEDLLTKEKIELGCGIKLEQFVAFDGEWYSKEAPFNCVLLDDGGLDRVVYTDTVYFEVRPYL